MPSIKTQSERAAELERLRRELLRKIIASEARRQAARDAVGPLRVRRA